MWYSSESARRELSNEYQHDRVKMVFKIFCILNCAFDESNLTIRRVKVVARGTKMSWEGINRQFPPADLCRSCDEVFSWLLCPPQLALLFNSTFTRRESSLALIRHLETALSSSS